MSTRKSVSAARRTYRHGDLRRALLEAGIALVRESGPDAAVLREAARRAGVAPNAVYRHFESRAALFESIRAAALSALAVTMEKRLAALGPERGTLGYARATVRAVGTAYLRFARTETGLFRTAFALPFDVARAPDPRQAGRSGLNPFQRLGATLDRLMRAGGLPAAHRPGAEYVAWSAVHGLAMLSIDGPLRRLPARQRDALEQRLLDMVEQGLGVTGKARSLDAESALGPLLPPSGSRDGCARGRVIVPGG
jgi:AcrR family transcriptional regulator